jgi:hypothetical protein
MAGACTHVRWRGVPFIGDEQSRDGGRVATKGKVGEEGGPTTSEPAQATDRWAVQQVPDPGTRGRATHMGTRAPRWFARVAGGK